MKEGKLKNKLARITKMRTHILEEAKHRAEISEDMMFLYLQMQDAYERFPSNGMNEEGLAWLDTCIEDAHTLVQRTFMTDISHQDLYELALVVAKNKGRH